MADVVLENVYKRFPNGFEAISDLNLEINEGEFLVMVGPSGCGKSTTLRMIAGLEEISAGRLIIGGRVVNDVPAKDRDIAMVFQNYALYPHMTVAQNIGFALKLAKTAKPEIEARVAETARILELTELLDRKPGQLSGGQRQRVAMGRAIVRRPRVFLLDEPLSNLDAKLRVQTRGEINRIQREVGVTTFYVTHDQVEAMTMADRVAVIEAGVLQQVAPPQDLYDHPHNLFVAAFIGSPAMNLMEGRLESTPSGAELVLGTQRVEAGMLLAANPALRDHVGRDLVIGLRGEDIQDAAVDNVHATAKRMRADVLEVEALGHEKIAYIDFDAPIVRVGGVEPGADEIPGHSRFSARFDPTSQVGVGDRIEIAVSVHRAHVFDPETGLAIR